MTAEIAIMNRYAVVLAADSATTVTSWNDGQQERRYFKGANKLFELSRHAPVGLMIFGSSSLQGVPWELVIKSFRGELGDEQHDVLSAYATHFFDYVQRHDKLFPASDRPDVLMNTVGGAAWRLQAMLAAEMRLSESGPFDAIAAADFGAALQVVEQQIEAMPLDPPMTDADLTAALATSTVPFGVAVKDSLPIFKDGPAELHQFSAKFAEVLIKLAVKEFKQYADVTGIVIAGYGKYDYFPAMEVFECYGFLNDRLIFSRTESESRIMDASAPAVIQPFATTSMIETFRFGVAPNIFGGVVESTNKTLRSFATKVLDECGKVEGIPEARLEELITEAVDGHTEDWFQETRQRHFRPLSQVIHSLPLQDMAALAKSLIELESLKERVTKPSESVSGPIDVAVISKHDGFVWIERKHYFRAELNPRFFSRSN
jgi:hypothetical protein